MRSLISYLTFIYLFFICPISSTGQNKPAPEFTWGHASAESVGMSAQKLEVLKQSLMSRGTKKFLI